jgi:DNA-binding LacI/PurR family transcriptional regulator
MVLNGKPNISPQVRANVLAAADKLGYRLPERRSASPESPSQPPKTISILHYARYEYEVGSTISGLLMHFLEGAQAVLQEQEVNRSLIANYRDDNEQDIGHQILQNERFMGDGLIIVGIPSRQSKILQTAIKNNFPTIVLGRDWPELPISTVSISFKKQTEIALKYLIDLGHRKIAFLSSNLE